MVVWEAGGHSWRQSGHNVTAFLGQVLYRGPCAELQEVVFQPRHEGAPDVVRVPTPQVFDGTTTEYQYLRYVVCSIKSVTQRKFRPKVLLVLQTFRPCSTYEHTWEYWPEMTCRFCQAWNPMYQDWLPLTSKSQYELSVFVWILLHRSKRHRRHCLSSLPGPNCLLALKWHLFLGQIPPELCHTRWKPFI